MHDLPHIAKALSAPLATTWSALLVDYAIDAAIIVVVAGFILCVARLLRGPHLADRALALDTIAIHVIALVVLFTLRLDSLVLFDGVLVLSLLGFAGTIAVAQYIARPHLRKPNARDLPADPDD